MTHNRRRVWTRRSIINVGDGRKVLGSGIGSCVSLRRPCDAGIRHLCCACACGVAGHSAAQQSSGKVWRVAYLYPSMRGPYKKIDAALR